MLLEIIRETFGLFFACLVLAFFLHLAIEVVELLFRKFWKKGRAALIDELIQYRVAKKPDYETDYDSVHDVEFDFPICPSCHVFLSEGQAFCMLCGQKILWEKESEEKLNE